MGLITALLGRAWCGWACPQTVFIEGFFRRVEAWIEGDHLARRALAKAPWSFGKFSKKALKWSAFLAGSLVITHSFLAYFVGPHEVLSMMTKAPAENPGSFFLVLLATGGLSRPETGSTGDGFTWLKNIGHTIIKPSFALVPVAIKDEWVKKLQGVTIPSVKITLLQDGQKQGVKKGKILFTHFGVSGPTVLNMSKDIGELLKYGDVTVSLDLFPASGHDKLNLHLQDFFKQQNKKKIKNCLGEMIPSALVPIVLELTGVDPETLVHSITRDNRLKLITTLKNLTMTVAGLLGADKAIVSSGGIDLTEVDFKTMSSRLYPNLYVVGDVLNIDRPSGGYSLQLCWTTGYVAGTHAGQKSHNY
jgi:predicted Rossmann fold flavoprotein